MNSIVEINESKFGRRKYNRGHKVEGVWVVGAVERTQERRIVLESVEKRNENVLTSFCKNNVKEGNFIFTDMWREYLKLSSFGFKHFMLNHSVEFVYSENGVHTNTIEGNWAAVKKMYLQDVELDQKLIII